MGRNRAFRPAFTVRDRGREGQRWRVGRHADSHGPGAGPAAIAAGPVRAEPVTKTIIVSRAKRLESFINFSLSSTTNGMETRFEA
tara:strand:+ start:1744 stop:1998 length:255 start_codon:yes stop_codon:yes gene_type:complete